MLIIWPNHLQYLSAHAIILAYKAWTVWISLHSLGPQKTLRMHKDPTNKYVTEIILCKGSF